MSVVSPGALRAGSSRSLTSLFDMTFDDLHLTCDISFGGEDGIRPNVESVDV